MCVCVDKFQNDYLENVPLNAKIKDSGGHCVPLCSPPQTNFVQTMFFQDKSTCGAISM